MSATDTPLNAQNLQPTGTALSAPQDGAALLASSAPKKPKRTLGLKLFDNFLYTFLTNTTVFAVSVGFTYLTKHGASYGEEGSTARSIGNWFVKRSEPIREGFEKLGLKGKTRDNATMVFFSFADGTLFAPLVKLFEDRREKIAYKIDSVLGTKPKDESVYIAEPKQTWGSVILGRILTLSLVLPTAILLNRKMENGSKLFNVAPGSNLNATHLEIPGEKLGTKVVNEMPRLKSKIQSIFGKSIKIPELFAIGRFELFYTTVCTIGLYMISRGLARKHPTEEQVALKEAKAHALPSPTARDEAPKAETAPTLEEKPRATITAPTLHERVAEPQQAASLTT